MHIISLSAKFVIIAVIIIIIDMAISSQIICSLSEL